MSIRPYRPTDDVDDLVGDRAALTIAYNHAHVAQGFATITGLAIWHEPESGAPNGLFISLRSGGTPADMYALVEACVEDAIARGHTQATFTIYRRALLQQLQRDFTISAIVTGRRQRRGAVEWDVTVDLADALDQLQERRLRQ